MRATFPLLIALCVCGCTATRVEREQQAYWQSKAKFGLAAGMSKAEVLGWAEDNSLAVATGTGLVLRAKPVDTRWPHFPCAKTFTMISLTFDPNDKLTSFTVGRGGVCL